MGNLRKFFLFFSMLFLIGKQQMFSENDDQNKVKNWSTFENYKCVDQSSTHIQQMNESSIIKSRNDQRTYASLTLPNQLTCVIIRDEDAEISSAALSMGVGSFKDPITSQGIAHYLEHMLFMGTQKYPDENSYSNFITTNSGKNNAYTSQQETNYQFQISNSAFEGALDRFAQFFIGPLMSESSSARELNAVDSEHSKNILNDMWRKFQLSKHISKKDSPYNKFSTGNKETLTNENLPKILREFYDQNYSANLMKLVVYGKQDIETLKKWVTEYFSAIPNKNYSRFKLPGIPFDGGSLKKMFKIVPVKDMKKLELCWIVSDQRQHYKNHPGRYISHMIGHEGKGSLLSYLMKNHLATALSAGAYDSYETFCEFSVTIDLTDKGLLEIENIISYTLFYFQNLKENGVQEWIFKEIQKILQLKFQFLEKRKGMMVTAGIAKNMHTRKIEELNIEPYLMEEWKPEIIKSFINELTLQNLIVFAEAKQFQKQCDLEEPVYKTKFTEIPLGEIQPKPCDIGLPEKNIFIPTDLSVLPLAEKVSPKKIFESELVQFFYKPDHTFSLPKININVRINFKGTNTAKEDVERKLFSEMLTEQLREFAYLAETAEIESNVNFVSYYSMEIKLKGYRDSLNKFLAEYIKRIFQYVPEDQKLFETLRAKIKRQYSNAFLEDPFRLVYELQVNSSRFGSGVQLQERIKEVDLITFESLINFSKNWHKQVFTEGYVGGNVLEETVIDLIKTFNQTLSQIAQPLSKENINCVRAVMLPENKVFIVEKALVNPQEENAAIAIHFQGKGNNDHRTDILFTLLESITKEPAFDYLRTKEQLGYIVFCLNEDHRGVGGITFIIQSTIKTSFQLQRYIDIFINEKLREILNSLTEEKFNNYRSSLLNSKMQKDKNLAAETLRMWTQIVKHKYVFTRKSIEIETIPTITLEQVLNFAQELFYKNQRRLQIHMNPEKKREQNEKVKKEKLQKKEKEVQLCKNSLQCSKKLPLYPDFYAHP